MGSMAVAPIYTKTPVMVSVRTRSELSGDPLTGRVH